MSGAGSEYSLVLFVTHTDNLGADDTITAKAVVAIGDGVLGICIILNTDGNFDKNGFHGGSELGDVALSCNFENVSATFGKCRALN